MKCLKCGCEFEEGIFCPECGTQNLMSNVNQEGLNSSEEESALNNGNDGKRDTNSESVNAIEKKDEGINADEKQDNKQVKKKGSTGEVLMLVLSIVALVFSCLGVGGCIAIPILIISIVMLVKRKKKKTLWASVIIATLSLIISGFIWGTTFFGQSIAESDTASENGILDKIWVGIKTTANYGYEEETEEKENSIDDTNTSENANNTIDNNQTTDFSVNKQNLDAADYRNISEEELINSIGGTQNEYGIYPSIDNPIFMCEDGYVKTIVLDNDDEYSFLDLFLKDEISTDKCPLFNALYSESISNGAYREYSGADGTVGIQFESDNSNIITAISWVSAELENSADNQVSDNDDGYTYLFDEFYRTEYSVWDREKGEYVDIDPVTYTLTWYEDADLNSKLVFTSTAGFEYIGYFPGTYGVNINADGWWIVELSDKDGNTLEIQVDLIYETGKVNTIWIEDYDDFYSRNLSGLYYNDQSDVPAAGGPGGSDPT